MVSSCSIHAAHTASPSSSPRTRLSALRAALEAETHAPENAAVFEAVRYRCSVLAPHLSPSSVMAALSNRTPNRYREKEAVTRALIVEAQAGNHRLWSAILVLAYLPMLMRLSGRIRSDVPEKGERDQLVVTSFLEAIRTIRRDRTWLCLSIRRITERCVWQHLGRERKMHRFICSVDPDDLRRLEAAAVAGDLLGDGPWAEIRPTAGTRGLEADEREAAIAYLHTHAGHVLDPEEVAIVTTTAIDGERLTGYIERLYPYLDQLARQHQYQRLKRRHSRAMAKLRLLFADHWERMRSGEDELPWVAAAAA